MLRNVFWTTNVRNLKGFIVIQQAAEKLRFTLFYTTFFEINSLYLYKFKCYEH